MAEAIEGDPPPVVIGNDDEEATGTAGESGDDVNSVTKLTYKEKALAAGRNYTVTDVPPLGTSIILGVQHYLTMLGATVSITLAEEIVVPLPLLLKPHHLTTSSFQNVFIGANTIDLMSGNGC